MGWRRFPKTPITLNWAHADLHSSMEMTPEADKAITELFATAEHDTATEAWYQMIEVCDATDADSLAVLETLSLSQAVSKWQALHARIVDISDGIHTDLLNGTLGSGPGPAEPSGCDCTLQVEEEHRSRSRGPEIGTDTSDGPAHFPADALSHLREHSEQVLEWLAELQRSCEQRAARIKHRRFVRLCHQVTEHGQPPRQVAALDSQNSGDTGTANRGRESAPSATSGKMTSASERSPAAMPRWGLRILQAITKQAERRPMLSLILVLAVTLPAGVWGTWHTFVDVNRAVSSFCALVLILATTRPLLKNILWAIKILLDTPIRIGYRLADSFDTDRTHHKSA